MLQRFAHILLVDDDAEVCGVRCAMLEEMGYRVSTAKDAVEARSILEQEDSVNLLVTDDRMFGEKGSALAEHAAARGIAALIISGHNDSIIEFDGGSRLFLKKPFHFEELENKVIEALGQPTGSPDES